jgi:hypothetical protein
MMWWDPAVTEAGVLARLRLTDTDFDIDLIRQSIPAVAATIEQWADRVEPLPGPPPPADLQWALEVAAVALYHQGGAVATIGPGPVTAGAGTERFDPLTDVYTVLAPYKQGWAVA